MKQNAFVTISDSTFSPFYFLRKDFERDYDWFQVSNEEDKGLDYFESDEAYLATIDIPGVELSDVAIELIENKMTISAERKNLLSKDQNKSKKYNLSLSLPKNIQVDSISAHYENGVLILTIPKNLEIKTKKQIEITTGSKPKSWSSFLSLKKPEHDKIANWSRAVPASK